MIKSNKLPSLEYLNECFQPDFENGILYWKKRSLYHFKNMDIIYLILNLVVQKLTVNYMIIYMLELIRNLIQYIVYYILCIIKK